MNPFLPLRKEMERKIHIALRSLILLSQIKAFFNGIVLLG